MPGKSAKYNPNRPQSRKWASLSEGEQIASVLKQHRKHEVPAPNPRIHAATHVIVENQILLGDETPVATTLERLMAEGLSRHDAIHAMGSVLAPLMMEILRSEVRSDPNLVYYKQLRDLTAEGWLAEFS